MNCYDIIQKPAMLIASRKSYHQNPVGISQSLRNDYIKEKHHLVSGSSVQARYLNYVPRQSVNGQLSRKETVSVLTTPKKKTNSVEQLRLPLIQAMVFRTIDQKKLEKSKQIKDSRPDRRRLINTIEQLGSIRCSIGTEIQLSELDKSQIIHKKYRPAPLPSNLRSRYSRIERKDPQVNMTVIERQLAEAPTSELDDLRSYESTMQQHQEINRIIEERKKVVKRKKKQQKPKEPTFNDLQPWETIEYEDDFQQ